jgi:hypothetical protein
VGVGALFVLGAAAAGAAETPPHPPAGLDTGVAIPLPAGHQPSDPVTVAIHLPPVATPSPSDGPVLSVHGPGAAVDVGGGGTSISVDPSAVIALAAPPLPSTAIPLPTVPGADSVMLPDPSHPLDTRADALAGAPTSSPGTTASRHPRADATRDRDTVDTAGRVAGLVAEPRPDSAPTAPASPLVLLQCLAGAGLADVAARRQTASNDATPAAPLAPRVLARLGIVSTVGCDASPPGFFLLHARPG